MAVESYYKTLQRISTAYKALVSISPPYSCADPGIFVRGGGGDVPRIHISVRLSVMLSPPKPLDEIQLNLICELLT